MIDELCIVGYPGSYGGAGSELDHQITCWQAMGIVVHILPLQSLDRRSFSTHNHCCVYHGLQDWPSLEGLHVISFCDKRYLQVLPEIRKFARTTTFVNCMMFNLEGEIEAHQQGLIDFHLYQTQHAMDSAGRRLSVVGGPFRPLLVTPYFRVDDFPFTVERDESIFRFGRISRASIGKYAKNQFRIYQRFASPLPKDAIVLGWSRHVEAWVGAAPGFVRTFAPAALSQQEFYGQVEAVIMSTTGTENLPRVGFEAMASGCPLVVDRRGGWELQVEDGATGFLCSSEDEFVYKAARIAFEAAERKEMAFRARERLEEGWGLQRAMDSWSQVFQAWETFS